MQEDVIRPPFGARVWAWYGPGGPDGPDAELVGMLPAHRLDVGGAVEILVEYDEDRILRYDVIHHSGGAVLRFQGLAPMPDRLPGRMPQATPEAVTQSLADALEEAANAN